MDNIEPVSKFLAFESTSSPVFFILANFRNLATKKKAGESNKGVFEFLKKKSNYLDKTDFEIARFRQCVHVGRQN
jgi:hypothetical protein